MEDGNYHHDRKEPAIKVVRSVREDDKLWVVTVEGKRTSASTCSMMLSSSNYNVWLLHMKAIMKVYKVWEAIEPGSTDEEKNNMAVVLIFQSIPESMIMQIGDLDSPKAIWDAIKSRNVGADRVKEARLQTLATEFDNLRMKETEAIDDFAGKLSCIASKSASLGETMDETKLVKKFLKSLPRGKYIHIVATLEQTLDLKTIKFEDIVGRLKAYEEGLKEEDVVEPQSKLLFNKTETSSSSTNNRARGQGTRGRGGNRGRGNRDGNNSSRSNREEGSSNENKNRSKEKTEICPKSNVTDVISLDTLCRGARNETKMKPS
ncbi:uncharacterized protein LOC110907809 [Helianthus annuus]|uniref:uncharacterized protein LOC110907809 n=1 Tax=Helianthus annuus TaxID=4232 RepID=UPI000B8FA5C2|nr:uncharacterized protein LOC110907809 [Helianthus annuus]